MDIQNKIKLTRRFYLGLKTFHLVFEIIITSYIAKFFEGDNYLHCLRNTVAVLIMIIISWFTLISSYKRANFNYTVLESLTFVIILILFLYATHGISKMDKSQGKSNYYTSKLKNPETSANPAYKVDKATIEELEETNRYLIGKTKYLRDKTIEYFGRLENSSELRNSLYKEVSPGVPSIDYEFLLATLNEYNVSMNEYSAIQNETINENSVATSEHIPIQNETINEYATNSKQLISRFTYLRKKAIDYIDGLENSSDLINSLYEEILSGIPAIGYEFNSATQNGTINEYVRVSPPTTPDPSILSKMKFTTNLIVQFSFASVTSLIIQVALIIVASLYRKVFTGHMNELMQAAFHQTNDGDGEVNIGFQSTEESQNNLEAGS